MKKLKSSNNNQSKKKSFQNFLEKIKLSQDNSLIILGGIVGILGGIGAIIFHEAIHFIEELFFNKGTSFFDMETFIGSDDWQVRIILICIPAIGGLLVGLISHYFEKGEEGEGIPNVIDAIASKDGIIKGSIAVKKIIGSALSIGTGGAGGKEGPIVQIGASIASSFGRLFHLTPDRLRILVGCGGAAGLAAAFNAPLGGALFAMEILLRTFRAKTFSPIIISTVFATALSRSYLGNETSFSLPSYELISNYELIFYVILGLLSGLVAIYFVKVFYYIEEFWTKIKVSKIFKPAIGGLVVGVIGIFLPGVYGFSYDSVNLALSNSETFIMLLALLFLKPVATAMTIGSGGNGGTFAPSIFTGAMLGGLFGQIINYMFPELGIMPGSYALVGMAAVVAGTTHASLTALIMIFEMTNDYEVILPLMLTIIIATTVSKVVLKGDLYSLNFLRRGKEIDIYGRKTSVLKKIEISTIVEDDYDFILDNFTFKKTLDVIRKSHYNLLLVKDIKDNIVGEISFENIRDTLLDDETKHIQQFLIARDFMTKKIQFVNIDDTAEKAFNLFEGGEFDFLPVLNKEGKLEGIVSRTNLLRKYQKEVFIQQSTVELGMD
ncbi:MAG: chloride channel protein [Melioribacteraceae bacterium]|nr:chloride channel protein [Melioribacteraceae bacterium]